MFNQIVKAMKIYINFAYLDNLAKPLNFCKDTESKSVM